MEMMVGLRLMENNHKMSDWRKITIRCQESRSFKKTRNLTYEFDLRALSTDNKLTQFEDNKSSKLMHDKRTSWHESQRKPDQLFLQTEKRHEKRALSLQRKKGHWACTSNTLVPHGCFLDGTGLHNKQCPFMLMHNVRSSNLSKTHTSLNRDKCFAWCQKDSTRLGQILNYSFWLTLNMPQPSKMLSLL